MWLLGFYRFYLCLCTGIAFYAFLVRSVWLSLVIAIVARTLWYGIERSIDRISIGRDFSRHAYSFKQQLGPYGIRLANQAEKDFSIRKSLAEVFVSDPARLRKNVEQLRMMDTLFQAGMRPDGDAYLLHDCKLKYGTHRLDRLQKSGTA